MDFKSSKLPRNALPTNRDIIEAINFEKKKNGKVYKTAIATVVNDLIAVWEKISVPLVTKRQITRKMQNYHATYMEIVNGNQRRLNHVNKVQHFKVI